MEQMVLLMYPSLPEAWNAHLIKKKQKTSKVWPLGFSPNCLNINWSLFSHGALCVPHNSPIYNTHLLLGKPCNFLLPASSLYLKRPIHPSACLLPTSYSLRPSINVTSARKPFLITSVKRTLLLFEILDSFSLYFYTHPLLASKFSGAGTMIYTSLAYSKVGIKFHNTIKTRMNVPLFPFSKFKHF